MVSSVFIGTSVDGFIARSNDSFDFLPAGGGEPHGYDEFMAGIDALVMGRRTYDVVRKFTKWPFEGKLTIVLSSRPSAPEPKGARVECMSGEPGAIVAALSARGVNNLYIDGGRTIQGFLRANQIHRLIVTRVPVLIGTGIALFGDLIGDIELQHVATRSFLSGLVQNEYRVLGAPAPEEAIVPLW